MLSSPSLSLLHHSILDNAATLFVILFLSDAESDKCSIYELPILFSSSLHYRGCRSACTNNRAASSFMSRDCQNLIPCIFPRPCRKIYSLITSIQVCIYNSAVYIYVTGIYVGFCLNPFSLLDSSKQLLEHNNPNSPLRNSECASPRISLQNPMKTDT